MNTVLLVAARLASTRLPRKALIEVGGRSILEHLLRRVATARRPERTVLCTTTRPEDDALEAVALRNGAGVFRGSESDVLERFVGAARREGAATVVRVTGDNPLTDPELLDRMVAFHEAERADYTYTEDPPRGTRCEIISVAALERAYALSEDRSNTEHLTRWFRQPEYFRLARFELEDPALRRPGYRLTIDTAEDLCLFEELHRALYDHGAGDFPPLAAIIGHLDRHPELTAINRGIHAAWEQVRLNTRLRPAPAAGRGR